MPDAVIHHSVHGTHWLDAAALRDAIEDRHPALSVSVAHTPADLLDLLAEADVLLTSFLDASVLDEAIAMCERGVWERFTGGELAQRTLGVVGLGAIGRRTAELAGAVGMDVVGTKADPSEAVPVVDRVYGPDDLSAVLLESDSVVLACPLTEETEGLIGREELGVMAADAVLVNVARGPVVAEDALVTELQQRGIRGAALDVFATEPLPADSTLWDLSNVILTPHNAGASPRLPDRIADIFVANYDAYRDGAPERMQNRVL